MAISASNTGGAWDNAKKYIEAGHYRNEAGEVRKKGSDEHKAAVIGKLLYLFLRWYCWWPLERYLRTITQHSY